MDELLNHYGSQYQIAKRFSVSRAYVCQWFAAGHVPAKMAVLIEKDTEGKLKAIDLVGVE